ncbi:MAG: bifunctional phosphopantothenoylcysteine decarboxylase/phosphopantothenate--cysteine ligase CoaBC [Cytophagaceae bacterium]
MLRNKKILLGICGSIAAYKSALLTRLLVKEGAEVQVIMTASASDFITPLTLSTLSKRPALTEFTESGSWNNHVELALWADLIVIAPASLNTMAKMATGACDNLLLATYFSAKCPVMIAPAMDLDMYKHQATKDCILKLKDFGNHVIDAESGELASGLSGEGRMAEPEHIMQKIKDFFTDSFSKINGKKILVTAGPTYESIDPVRFIGNHSSGKMGFELARLASESGADVTLVTGPTQLFATTDINLIRITNAGQMYEQVMQYAGSADVIILAAAVADFTPEVVASEKIKKQSEEGMSLKLVKTKDIAAEVGKVKKKNQIIVGFALETENELENARKKLQNKNFDFIVLNSLKDQGAGFGYDTNKITILTKDNKIKSFELKSKREAASDILIQICQLL